MQQRTNLPFIRSFIAVSMTLMILHSEARSVSEDNEPVCETEFCREIANEIIASMDTKVDPCKDFYKYTCGNWLRKVTDKEIESTQFTILNNKTKFHLKKILESEKSAYDNSSVLKMKQLYRACMDTSAIETRGLTGLMNLIEQQGGWPLTLTKAEWKQKEKPWQEFDTSINEIMGDSRLFKILVKVDIQNSSSHIISLSSPRVNIPAKFPSPSDLDEYMELDSVVDYRELITKIARIITNQQGSFVSDDDLNIGVKNIVAFEAKLYKITMTEINETKPDVGESYRKTNISQFQEIYNNMLEETAVNGKINWLDRIKSVFSIVPEIQIDGSTLISVTTLQYFSKLAKLLRDTPSNVIIDAMQWWMIKELLPYTNQEMVNLLEKSDPKSKTHFSSDPQQRWLFCVSRNGLQHALGYAYIQKHFPEDSKIAALNMVNGIAHEMGKDIRQSSWLDSYSKQSALEKLNAMKEFIGFPDWYSDSEALEKFYVKLLVGKDHLENHLAVRKFGLRLNLEVLDKPVDRKKWITSPTIVNAFYHYPGNSLTIPAAMLQAPFFSKHQPDAVNFGGIGSVIGHEISHGFDDVGRQYNKDGNLRNWWSNNTLNEFKQRTKCFISKYKKFGISHNETMHKLNPMMTLSENIADSIGIRVVYKAFETHLTQSPSSNMRLPGLENLSTRQLFFLSYANTFCEAMPLKRVLEILNSDAHCPSAFRITGTLSNIEEFAESFKCPAGSLMNPKVRCGIWY